jgi:hypothetical protein
LFAALALSGPAFAAPDPDNLNAYFGQGRAALSSGDLDFGYTTGEAASQLKGRNAAYNEFIQDYCCAGSNAGETGPNHGYPPPPPPPPP